jgi:hypothetical protein
MAVQPSQDTARFIAGRFLAGFVLITALLAFTACTPLPDVEGAIPADERQGNYPELIPAGQITAQAQDNRIAEQDEAAINARIRALRARANWLRTQ